MTDIFDDFTTEHLKKTESNEIIIILADGCGEMNYKELTNSTFDFELVKTYSPQYQKYRTLTMKEEEAQFKEDHIEWLDEIRQHPEYNLASDKFYAVQVYSSYFYVIKLKDEDAPMWFLHTLEISTLSRLMTMSGDDECYDYFPAQVEVYEQLCDMLNITEHGERFTELLRSLYTQLAHYDFPNPEDKELRDLDIEEICGSI